MKNFQGANENVNDNCSTQPTGSDSIIIIIIIIMKKLWNMQVTIIPIVISAFGTVTKGLLKGLEDLEFGGWVETIQTTALLRTAWILRRVLETWGDLLSLRLQWKTIG